MATLLELANMAAAVYGNVYGNAPLPVGATTVVTDVSGCVPRDGFLARTYQPATTTDLVVAFRGTVVGGGSLTKIMLANIVADIELTVHRTGSAQRDAADYLAAIIAAYPKVQITVIGHSLGGHLAQFAAAAAARNGQAVSSVVTFQSPAVSGDVLDWATKSHVGVVGLNFFNRGDLIHYAGGGLISGGHIGHVHSLPAGPTISAVLLHPLISEIVAHDITPTVDYLAATPAIGSLTPAEYIKLNC